MCRVTLAGIIPILCVETEEELQILRQSQPDTSHRQMSRDYPHGVCLRAIHVPKEKISKFDGIQPSEEQPALALVLAFGIFQARDLPTLEYAHHSRLL